MCKCCLTEATSQQSKFSDAAKVTHFILNRAKSKLEQKLILVSSSYTFLESANSYHGNQT